MNAFMLWFDNNQKSTLTEKILQAAEYYRHKYERVPELCLINPRMAADNPTVKVIPFAGGEITVRPWNGTLSHHFWVGIEEAKVESGHRK